MSICSTNGGESYVHAVERCKHQGHGMVDAIRRAYHDLKGSYSFVIGQLGEERLSAPNPNE